MTINDILAEIINEVGGDSSDTTLTTKMLGFFKAGYRHIPAFIRDRNFTAVASYTLLAASNTVALTNFTGFIREREIWFEGDNGIHIPIYKPPSLQYFHKVINPQKGGKPFYYRIYAQTLQFDKLADAGLIIGMDYFKAVSSIAGTDTWLADEQLMEGAKHFCKMIYFSDYEEDTEKASENERRGKDIIARLEEEYEVQELGGYVDEKY